MITFLAQQAGQGIPALIYQLCGIISVDAELCVHRLCLLIAVTVQDNRLGQPVESRLQGTISVRPVIVQGHRGHCIGVGEQGLGIRRPICQGRDGNPLVLHQMLHPVGPLGAQGAAGSVCACVCKDHLHPGRGGIFSAGAEIPVRNPPQEAV